MKNQIIKDRACYMLATGMYFGLAPIIPGTVAALVGLIIHLIIIFILPYNTHFVALLFFFLLFSSLCLTLNAWAETYWNVCDHKNFVLDEIAGYLFVPLLFRSTESIFTAVYGFILFRFFDIIKFFPANIVDKNMKNKWGVLIDDLISAAYAALVLHLFY